MAYLQEDFDALREWAEEERKLARPGSLSRIRAGVVLELLEDRTKDRGKLEEARRRLVALDEIATEFDYAEVRRACTAALEVVGYPESVRPRGEHLSPPD